MTAFGTGEEGEEEEEEEGGASFCARKGPGETSSAEVAAMNSRRFILSSSQRLPRHVTGCGSDCESRRENKKSARVEAGRAELELHRNLVRSVDNTACKNISSPCSREKPRDGEPGASLG